MFDIVVISLEIAINNLVNRARKYGTMEMSGIRSVEKSN